MEYQLTSYSIQLNVSCNFQFIKALEFLYHIPVYIYLHWIEFSTNLLAVHVSFSIYSYTLKLCIFYNIMYGKIHVHYSELDAFLHIMPVNVNELQ
jgi:hypothetical protein